MKKIIAVIVFGFMHIFAADAYAGKSVSSPYAEKDKWEIEAKTEIDLDDDNDDVNGTWEQSIKLGYGVTDFLKVEAGYEFEDEPGEDLSSKVLEVEALVELTEGHDTPVDAGIKFKYKYNLAGDADEISSKLIFAKKYAAWQHYFNAQIKKEIGEDHGDNEKYDIAWKTKYKGFKAMDLGVEYYGDFSDTTGDYDDQKHRIGPVVYADIGDTGFEFETGVLAGISDAAPDATLKLNLEYGF